MADAWTSLVPDPAHANAIDAALRDRLGKSFEYVGETIRQDGVGERDLSGLQAKIHTGPLSPWVFALYSKLVAELSRQSRDVAGTFDDIITAASLPAASGVVAFHETAIPDRWWDHFSVLFDTDRRRPFHVRAPAPADFSTTRDEIGATLALMQRADPTLHEEVSSLLRTIVLARPVSDDSADNFNGASTFFTWGSTLINAELRRSNVIFFDLLVHESGHLLLFGLSADEPLVTNSGDERYASPLRTDKRPIDGIFHACFVATRVHLALGRLLASGVLASEETKEAIEQRAFNGKAARGALELLRTHARTTATGKRILNALGSYWSSAEASRQPAASA